MLPAACLPVCSARPRHHPGGLPSRVPHGRPGIHSGLVVRDANFPLFSDFSVIFGPIRSLFFPISSFSF